MCRLRGVEYDTRLRLLGRCRPSVLFGKRRKQFGKHLLLPSELRQEHMELTLEVC